MRLLLTSYKCFNFVASVEKFRVGKRGIPARFTEFSRPPEVFR